MNGWGFLQTMINLDVLDHVRRAKYARRLLKQGIVWVDTFRNPTFKTFIIDLVRKDQLKAKGIDSEGSVIGYYSQTTARRDSRKPFNTHYTLDDTGDFYRSMFLFVTIDFFEIKADFAKMQDQEWWSEKILGLTDESLEKIRDAYKEKLQNYARELLLGRS